MARRKSPKLSVDTEAADDMPAALLSARGVSLLQNALGEGPVAGSSPAGAAATLASSPARPSSTRSNASNASANSANSTSSGPTPRSCSPADLQAMIDARIRASAAGASQRPASAGRPAPPAPPARNRFSTKFQTPGGQPILFNHTGRNLPKTPKLEDGAGGNVVRANFALDLHEQSKPHPAMQTPAAAVAAGHRGFGGASAGYRAMAGAAAGVVHPASLPPVPGGAGVWGGAGLGAAAPLPPPPPPPPPPGAFRPSAGGNFVMAAHMQAQHYAQQQQQQQLLLQQQQMMMQQQQQHNAMAAAAGQAGYEQYGYGGGGGGGAQMDSGDGHRSRGGRRRRQRGQRGQGGGKRRGGESQV